MVYLSIAFLLAATIGSVAIVVKPSIIVWSEEA
jgi:hypothetical protein